MNNEKPPMVQPRGYTPVTIAQARAVYHHCLQCSLESESLALELDCLGSDPESCDTFEATCLISGVMEGLVNLQRDVTPEIRDAFARANPYPAVVGNACSVSYLSLAEELARNLCLDLIEIIDREASLALRARQRFFREAIEWEELPEFSEEHVRKHLPRMRTIVVKHAPLHSDLLRVSVLLQSLGKSLSSDDRKPDNWERDSWMYEQRLLGKTVAEVRVMLRREHPNWNQLDSDQGVTIALRRFTTREELPWPIGQQG